MPNQSVQNNLSKDAQPKSKNNVLVLIFIIAVLMVICAVGYWYYFMKSGQVACTTEARVCPDGTSVGRIGPNCEFAECPQVKDETADWQIYRNEATGFEIKYPENLIMEEGSSEGQIYSNLWTKEIYENLENEAIASPFLYIISTSSKGMLLEDWINSYYGTNIEKQNIAKGDLKFIKVFREYEGGEGEGTCEFFIDKNNSVFIIGTGAFTKPDDKVFNQIISTFKFAK